MEEEIAEIGSSLDEKEEESDDQKEAEWSSYQCLPSNESNSLTHTISYLFDFPPCLPKEDECHIDKCDDPIDSFEISLFDEIDTCYTCDDDAFMNETYENDVATASQLQAYCLNSYSYT